MSDDTIAGIWQFAPLKLSLASSFCILTAFKKMKSYQVACDKVAWSENLKMTVSPKGAARLMSPFAILQFQNKKHFLKQLFLNVVIVQWIRGGAKYVCKRIKL